MGSECPYCYEEFEYCEECNEPIASGKENLCHDCAIEKEENEKEKTK